MSGRMASNILELYPVIKPSIKSLPSGFISSFISTGRGVTWEAPIDDVQPSDKVVSQELDPTSLSPG